MRTRQLRVTLAWVMALSCTLRVAAAETPGSSWQQYATPEEAGFDSTRLDAVCELAERSFSGAVFAAYRGHVILACGDVTRRFKCHSVRKSLLSALYGIYEHSGKIDLNKTLADIGIDDKPPLTEQEKQARLVDLISARSGIYHPAAYEPKGMRAARPKRGSHAPGTHWWYNNWDFNTSGAVFERLTSRTIFEAFEERIAAPIGMEDFRLADTFYHLEPGSSLYPAYLFRLSARDLARFAQLFIQEGKWNGERLIPASWVTESTRGSSESSRAYGYMWWVYQPGSFSGNQTLYRLNRVRMYAAQGTGGQFAAVIPERELVFVHRGDTDNPPRGRVPQTLRMVEIILAAQTGEPKEHPKLVPLQSRPFSNALPVPKERQAIAMSPEDMASYIGVYQANGTRMTVFTHNGRLFAHLDGEGEGELFADAKDVLFVKSAPVDIRFDRDSDGNISHANLSAFGETRRLGRIP